MLYIICGEDVVASRKKLSELIEGSLDVTRIDGTKELLSTILTSLEANSLFSKKRTIVIEYFLSIKPQDMFVDSVLTFQKDPDTTVILWDETEIDSKIKDKVKNAKIFLFSFPKYYYQFLDSFSPTSANTLKLLHEVLRTFEPEQVLYGLVRRVRQLLMVKVGRNEEFSNFKRMQSWQMGKLRRQADSWTEGQLTQAFLTLAELDEKLKTGGLTMPLSRHLDILLLPELN